jgi:hypothetical protein
MRTRRASQSAEIETMTSIEVRGIALREYLEHIIEERDRLYHTRFEASAIAVNAALAAQEKAVAAAFLASERAISKAEEAQKDYNVRSNEFRGQLDDQAKGLMPRIETMGMFKSMDEKLEAMRRFFESRLESQRLSFEKSTETQAKEIASLRESRSEIQGIRISSRETLSYAFALIGVAIAGVTLLLKFH